jgi:hypothetical protein
LDATEVEGEVIDGVGCDQMPVDIRRRLQQTEGARFGGPSQEDRRSKKLEEMWMLPPLRDNVHFGVLAFKERKGKEYHLGLEKRAAFLEEGQVGSDRNT